MHVYYSGCEIRVFERSDIVGHPNLSSDISLSLKLLSRVFSSNFVSAVFVIRTLVINFVAINQQKEQTSRQVSSTSRPLLEIKTINKNKKQRSNQAIKTSGVGFWRHKRSKRKRNKIFIKSPKFPISNLQALNQAKEQGVNVLSRHRNLLFWFLKSETK